MKKGILLVLFIINVLIVFSQDNSTFRHVKEENYHYDFYVALEHKKIKYNDTLYYYWYKSKKIMNTQGASSGDILNGSYKKYYISGQLAEAGNFKMGLKVGKWQTWDENGNLTSVYIYKKGIKNGRYHIYHDGNSTQEGKYKKGKEQIKKEPKEKVEKEKKNKDVDEEEEVEEKKGFLNKLLKNKKDKDKEPKKEKTEKIKKEKKVKEEKVKEEK